jgi:hypothetical protein
MSRQNNQNGNITTDSDDDSRENNSTHLFNNSLDDWNDDDAGLMNDDDLMNDNYNIGVIDDEESDDDDLIPSEAYIFPDDESDDDDLIPSEAYIFPDDDNDPDVMTMLTFRLQHPSSENFRSNSTFHTNTEASQLLPEPTLLPEVNYRGWTRVGHSENNRPNGSTSTSAIPSTSVIPPTSAIPSTSTITPSRSVLASTIRGYRIPSSISVSVSNGSDSTNSSNSTSTPTSNSSILTPNSSGSVSSISTQNGSVTSVNGSVTSANGSTTPANRSTTSTNRSTTPANRSTTSTNRSTTPTNSSSSTGENMVNVSAIQPISTNHLQPSNVSRNNSNQSRDSNATSANSGNRSSTVDQNRPTVVDQNRPTVVDRNRTTSSTARRSQDNANRARESRNQRFAAQRSINCFALEDTYEDFFKNPSIFSQGCDIVSKKNQTVAFGRGATRQYIRQIFLSMIDKDVIQLHGYFLKFNDKNDFLMNETNMKKFCDLIKINNSVGGTLPFHLGPYLLEYILGPMKKPMLEFFFAKMFPSLEYIFNTDYDKTCREDMGYSSGESFLRLKLAEVATLTDWLFIACFKTYNYRSKNHLDLDAEISGEFEITHHMISSLIQVKSSNESHKRIWNEFIHSLTKPELIGMLYYFTNTGSCENKIIVVPDSRIVVDIHVESCFNKVLIAERNFENLEKLKTIKVIWTDTTAKMDTIQDKPIDYDGIN